MGLPLEGLFLHLVHEKGFPLTIRDYLDALRALRLRYGIQGRESLRGLLATLWTRTDEEARILDQVFRKIPFPTDEEIATWTGQDLPEPAEENRQLDPDKLEERDRGTEQAPVPQIQFAAPTHTGLGLPQAQVSPSGRELFVLQPRPSVSLRSLIVTWRRFRRALRTGPRVELDVAATIAEQARRGALTSPVLVPARRNLARLIVLVDASPSMVAWQSLNPTLAESLREGRLGLGTLYYFHNVPDERLYERETLTHPVRLADLLDRHGTSTLLIVSDAGASRGRRNRERITETRRFLERVSPYWQPVAWVNPLPRRRWKGTSAERIARFPNLAMAELSDDGLVWAIDVLRGQRSA